MTISIDDLMKICSKKRDIFIEMEQVSKDIYAFLCTYRIEDEAKLLVELLDKRLALMKEVDTIDQKIGALNIYIKDADAVLTQQYKTYLNSIQQSVTNIQNIDKECIELVQKTKASLAEKLAKTRETSKATNAYLFTDAPTDAWFFDRKK